MHEELRYWQQQLAIAQHTGTAERIKLCEHRVKLYQEIIAGLQAAADRDSGDT